MTTGESQRQRTGDGRRRGIASWVALVVVLVVLTYFVGSAVAISPGEQGASTVTPGVERSAPEGVTAVEAPVAAPASAAVSAVPPAPLPVARRVLTVGDSAMVDAALGYEAAFRAAGAEEVVRGGIMGFGVTRTIGGSAEPLWRSQWPRLIDEVRPDLTIVMLGGWDLKWILAHSLDAYEQEVLDAARTLTSKGGSVLWLSMLPGGNDPYLGELNSVFARLPSQVPGVRYLQIDAALAGPTGAWPKTYEAADGSVVRLRKLDDWHLCQDGAVRLAQYVNDWAVAYRLASPAVHGWEKGPWWDDVAFDSPICWPPGAWHS